MAESEFESETISTATTDHSAFVDIDPSGTDLNSTMEGESAWSDPASNEVSEEFVGQWQKLISTTNWEKGKIILEWRQALIATEAPASCYSDEAWARRVGGVGRPSSRSRSVCSVRGGRNHD